jgi:UDP-glucose 4-epimerase
MERIAEPPACITTRSAVNMLIHQNAQPGKLNRVAVIGARGFIGAAICSQLEVEGINTIRLTSADVDLASTPAVDRLTDLLKPTDSVVMLAALTPDKGRDIATLMKNLTMMQHVCAALDRMGCNHLVYFSSDAVYDTTIARVAEDTPTSPRDLYGAMHYTREVMGRGLAKAPILILRPTLVYGADDTHNAYGPNRFRRAAQDEGKISLFGGGEETRDHIHVEDVATLVVLCLLCKSTGVLNVATGRSTSFKELAQLVAGQFGTPVEIVETARANPITHRNYDVTNLIKAFPDFHFIALEEGLARVHHETTERA